MMSFSITTRLALFSRVLVLGIQITSNWLIPDHDADAFRIKPLKNPTSADEAIHLTLAGFNKWDGSYFLTIAEDGYTQPQMFAFFPLFPALARAAALLVHLTFGPELISLRSCLMVSSWLLNTTLFVISAVLIQKLAARVLKDDSLAYATCVLYCINPASIFMSATYTETLFSTLTIGGLLAFYNQSLITATMLFGLSTATRSNGIILFGFFVYHWTQYLIRNTLLSLSTGRRHMVLYITLQSLKIALILIGMSIPVFGPFLIFQVYSFNRVCHSTKFTFPQLLFETLLPVNSALDTIPSSPIPQWCQKTLPVPYSNIQSEVWDVGIFGYYQLRKIPNFILALPVIILTGRAMVVYCRENWEFVKCLGLIPQRKSWEKYARSQGFLNEESFLPLAHMTFLVLFGVLFVHIEVLTRFLFSSCPILLMFAAHVVTDGPDSGFFRGQPPSSILETVKLIFRWTNNGPWPRLILTYFFLYFLLGVILHCNFFPWT